MNRGSRNRWKDHASVGGQPFCIETYSQSDMPSKISEGHVVVATCLQTEDSAAVETLTTNLRNLYERHSQIAVPIIYFPCALIYTGILIVYLMLWDKQSAQGWTVMAFSLSQLALYLVLITVVGMTIYSNHLLDQSTHYLCNAFGKASHFQPQVGIRRSKSTFFRRNHPQLCVHQHLLLGCRTYVWCVV